MSRKLPTKGSTDFFCRYLSTYIAKISSNLPENRKQSVSKILRDLQNATISGLSQLNRLGMIEATPRACLRMPDESANMPPDKGWEQLIAEDLVDNFGRYGDDAVSCLAEGLLYTNVLAHKFGANKVFYRGEDTFGWKLRSKIERTINDVQDITPRLTSNELREIERFQSEVNADKELSSAIFGDSIPHDEDPSWLPAMQHYDLTYGTRLLDLSKSVFTALYFACVSWSGEVDEKMDGILYSFFDSTSQWRGEYVKELRGPMCEMDDVLPNKLTDSFKNWEHPEYFRLYQSNLTNPRELAQDGVFLVRGILGGEINHGQNFKFRIPGACKLKIAKELWFAGYTPRRIVRGQIGVDAEKNLLKDSV